MAIHTQFTEYSSKVASTSYGCMVSYIIRRVRNCYELVFHSVKGLQPGES